MGITMAKLNVANIIVGVGFVALGATFAWPYMTAGRVARVENWAETITAKLLDAAVENPWQDDAGDRASWAKELITSVGGAEAARLRVVEPPANAEPTGGGYLEGKHYAYAVLERPIGGASIRSGQPTPVEVYAWPLSSLGPARTAFYFTGDGHRAYTHNLHSRYEGWRRPPRAGSGQAFHSDPRAPGTYRAQDGERWLKLPAKRQTPRR